MRRLAGLVVATSLLASVACAHATPYDGEALSPSAHVVKQRDEQLVAVGAYTLAGFWGLSMAAAGIGDLVCNGSCTDHAYDLLYLPLAGPAIAAAMPGTQRAGVGWQVVLIADSTVQVVGGVVALVAYLVPTKRVVTDAKEHAPSWLLSPGSAGAPLGLTFTLAGL